MKANFNFLPPENRAVLLDRKVLIASGTLFIASLFTWGMIVTTRTRGLNRLRDNIRQLQQARAAAAQERATIKFPREQIQKLVNQFTFIQKTIGADDFPWLRFYQAIESAIPADPSGRRRVHISHLERVNSKTWGLEGEATDWKDVARFQSQLAPGGAESASTAPREISAVQLLGPRPAVTPQGYPFKLQFDFQAAL